MLIEWHLGELLVRKGLISWEDLECTLEDQRDILKQRGRGAGVSKSSTLFLGEILIKYEWANWMDVETALIIQRETEQLRLIGSILVEEEKTANENLYRALAIQFNMQYVDFFHIKIQRAAVELVPHGFAFEYGIMPLVRDDQNILIAISNPLQVKAGSELQKLLKTYNVRMALAQREGIEQALDDYYR